ncbi:MAG: hypothetical protein B7Z62_05145, partial [Deltaproteobacteria bacterium 37-65-8]
MRIVQVGDNITVLSKLDRKKFKKVVGRVVFLNDRQFTVDNGKYRQSYLINDIKHKQIKVIPEKKEGDEEMAATFEKAREILPREKMAELLASGKKNVEIFRELGIAEPVFYALKKEYGLTVLTKPGSKSIVPGNG